MRKSLLAGLSLAVLGLGACAPIPKIEKIEDLTGDGRVDVLLKVESRRIFIDNYKWLAVQQEDGSFDEARAAYSTTSNHFFGKKEYFFDGEFYREAKSPDEKE